MLVLLNFGVVVESLGIYEFSGRIYLPEIPLKGIHFIILAASSQKETISVRKYINMAQSKPRKGPLQLQKFYLKSAVLEPRSGQH